MNYDMRNKKRTSVAHLKEVLCITGDRREIMYRKLFELRDQLRKEDMELICYNENDKSVVKKVSYLKCVDMWYKMQKRANAFPIAAIGWTLINLIQEEHPSIGSNMYHGLCIKTQSRP